MSKLRRQMSANTASVVETKSLIELEAKEAEDEGEGGEGNGAKLDNQLDKEQLERLDLFSAEFNLLADYPKIMAKLVPTNI